MYTISGPGQRQAAWAFEIRATLTSIKQTRLRPVDATYSGDPISETWMTGRDWNHSP